MNGNRIIIEIDSKGSVSSSSKIGMESESYSFRFVNGDFRLEVIIVSDDSYIEGLSAESLLGKVLSRMVYSETLFSAKSG